MEGTLGEDLPPLDVVGRDYERTRSLWIAALAVLLYDYFLTVNDEITYIWRKKRRIRTRVLFVAHRYWPIISFVVYNTFLALKSPSVPLCIFFLNWCICSAAITHLTIGCILVLRVIALYNESRAIKALCVFLLVGELISETVVIVLVSTTHKPLKLPPYFPGCVPGPDTKVPYAWAYWAPPAIFETCMFVLVLARAVALGWDQLRPTRSMMRILLVDSVRYFAGVLAFILANLVIWIVGRPTLFATLTGVVTAVHSILGCRMLFNISEAAHPWMKEPWREYASAATSGIEFARPSTQRLTDDDSWTAEGDETDSAIALRRLGP